MTLCNQGVEESKQESPQTYPKPAASTPHRNEPNTQVNSDDSCNISKTSNSPLKNHQTSNNVIPPKPSQAHVKSSCGDGVAGRLVHKTAFSSNSFIRAAMSSEIVTRSSLAIMYPLQNVQNSIFQPMSTADAQHSPQSPEPAKVSCRQKAPYANAQPSSEMARLTPETILTLQALPEPERTRQW